MQDQAALQLLQKHPKLKCNNLLPSTDSRSGHAFELVLICLQMTGVISPHTSSQTYNARPSCFLTCVLHAGHEAQRISSKSHLHDLDSDCDFISKLVRNVQVSNILTLDT